jgi:hypothetical protein
MNKSMTGQLKTARKESVKVSLKRELGTWLQLRRRLDQSAGDLDIVKSLNEAYRLLGEENTELGVRAATAFQEMKPRADFGPVSDCLVLDELSLKYSEGATSEERVQERMSPQTPLTAEE